MINQKKYWLSGGLIFAGVVLLSSLILMLAGDKLGLISTIAWAIEVISIIPLGLLLIGLLGLREETFIIVTGEFGTGTPTIIGLLSLIIIWFIIGAILGKLYGKIKNRNSN